MDRTAYVGNVTANITEETLHALFSHCGTITQVRISGDPTYNARFAFVEFADQSQAHTACMLNGLMLAERSLRVSMAKTGINKPSVGSAPAGGGLRPMMGTGGGGGRSNNDPDRVSRTIHIAGVDQQVTEQHLAQYFSVCGEVTAVRISGDGVTQPRFSWVEFSTRESAYGALSLDGQMLGTQQLRISPSKSAIQSNGLLKTQPPPPQQFVPPPMMAQPPPVQQYESQALPPPPQVPVGGPPPGPPPVTDGTLDNPVGNSACTIYVSGVDRTLSDSDLYQFFQAQCGTVVKVQLTGPVTQPTRFAYVEFETPQAAEAAQNLSGTFVGGYAIEVSPVVPSTQNTAGATDPDPQAAPETLNKVEEARALIDSRLKQNINEPETTSSTSLPGPPPGLPPRVEPSEDAKEVNEEESAGAKREAEAPEEPSPGEGKRQRRD